MFSLTSCSLIPLGNNHTNKTTTPVPDLVSTARALSTRIASNASYVQTAQVEATQRALGMTPMVTPTPPGLPVNLTPNASTPDTGTPGGSTSPTDSQNLPSDIPLPEGDKQDLFISQNLISFLTNATYNDVVAFYEQIMPLNGWIKSEHNSFVTDNSALLKYDKVTRTTSITIQRNPISNLTAIVITIKG